MLLVFWRLQRGGPTGVLPQDVEHRVPDFDGGEMSNQGARDANAKLKPSTEERLAYVEQQMALLEAELLRECRFRFGNADLLGAGLALLESVAAGTSKEKERDLGVCIFLLRRFRDRQDNWLVIGERE